MGDKFLDFESAEGNQRAWRFMDDVIKEGASLTVCEFSFPCYRDDQIYSIQRFMQLAYHRPETMREWWFRIGREKVTGRRW